MKGKIRFLLTVMMIVAALVIAGCGGDSEPASQGQSSGGSGGSSGSDSNKEKIIVRLSTTSSKGGALYEGAVKFAELVNQRSNGEIEVQVFPDGQLGTDMAAMDAHKTGAIEMSLPATAMAQKSPEFGVFDIPFLFANRDVVQEFAHGDIWKNDFQPLFEQHGMVGLAFWENGFRHITNNIRPINTPEDLKGIKLRVPESKLRVAMFKEFGANPVTMDFSEVFTALQQGVVDGQENPFVQIEAGRFYEVQKYLSLTNHTYTPGYLVASKVWWDKLSPEHQQLLTEAAEEAGDYTREYGASVEDQLLEKFKQSGMEVNTADVKAFQAKTEPVINILKESIDPAFVDKVIQAVQ